MIIGDDELALIEAEADVYLLEDYPISGKQVSAIIARLRQAERNVSIMEPYMRRAVNNQRMRRMNESWMLPRLGALVLSLAAACTSVILTGTLQRFYDAASAETMTMDVWSSFTTFAFSLALPMMAVFFPLFHIIDNTAARRLKEGKYDA